MAGHRTLSPPARQAVTLLGQSIRLARRERRWTVKELASRVGVGEVTMRKVERGDPSVSLGTACEAAALVGVTLFSGDAERVALESERVAARLALLPSSVRLRPTHDDF